MPTSAKMLQNICWEAFRSLQSVNALVNGTFIYQVFIYFFYFLLTLTAWQGISQTFTNVYKIKRSSADEVTVYVHCETDVASRVPEKDKEYVIIIKLKPLVVVKISGKHPKTYFNFNVVPATF